VSEITALVGPNEAGKSNTFEALYRINPANPQDAYNINEDWPVDDWGGKSSGAGKIVCHAVFELDADEIVGLYEFAKLTPPTPPAPVEGAPSPPVPPAPTLPKALQLSAWRTYTGATQFALVSAEALAKLLDRPKLQAWAKENLPTFVLIQDYEFSANYMELPELAQRLEQKGWANLSNDDQTILIVLELAKIDIKDFVQKGGTAEGRTMRSYDKRGASKYLSDQFSKLWRQKKVKFEIEIDGPTFNIMVTDEGMEMPVRLHRRSTGFRWHVSFAWKFTHASQGDYEGCILLLEEPGVHLHPEGQRDLLAVFERLSESNTILYTTHLASLLDPAYPERVRICEVEKHHAHVIEGVVSGQRAPMAVIEARLGLSGDQSGFLGNRQTLIVEGGDDLLVLSKLNGLMMASGKEHLSNRIHMWPAEGASKTPMFAGFLIGQGWDGGVLLDSDPAGAAAEKKIKDLYLGDIAKDQGVAFRALSIGKAAGLKGNEAAIEDLFPEQFYLDCVNSAFRVAIKLEDLPVDGSSMITKRVESVLKAHHNRDLDKRLILGEMLKRFDTWNTAEDLPKGTAKAVEKLFAAINRAFAPAETQAS